MIVSKNDLLLTYDNVSEIIKLAYLRVNTSRYKIVKIACQLDKSYLASYYISKIDKVLAGLGYPYKYTKSAYYLNTGMYYATYFSYDSPAYSYKEISNSVLVNNEAELLAEIYPNMRYLITSLGDRVNLKDLRDSSIKNFIQIISNRDSSQDSYDKEFAINCEYGATITIKKVNKDITRVPSSKKCEFLECYQDNFYSMVDYLLNEYEYDSGIQSVTLGNPNTFDEFYNIKDTTVVPSYTLYKYNLVLAKHYTERGKLRYTIVSMQPVYVDKN